MSKNYKYTASFSSIIRPVVSIERDKYLAKASLDSLRKFVPDIDTEKNVDLLPISVNAYIANRVNKNSDAVLGQSAVISYKNFINKPINLEHKRTSVVGFITSSHLAEFGTDNIITEDEALKSDKPFSVILGGILWSIVNENLVELVQESNDPSSALFNFIGGSFELGFTEFDLIVLDKNNKNIEDGRIISDAVEIAKLETKLRSFGGNGKLDENLRIHRLIKGDIIPLGLALTETPASEQFGISYKSLEILEMEIPETPKEKEPSTMLDESCNIKGNEEKISHLEKPNVITNSKTMKINNIKDITDESLKEISASSIHEFITEELKTYSEKFSKEKAEKEQAVNAAEEKIKALTNEHDHVIKELAEIKANLVKLEEEKVAREKHEKFNQRMASFDEQYELTVEDRQVLASQLQGLTEDQFELLNKHLSVLMKHKNKEIIAALKKEDDAKSLKHVTASVVAEVIESKENENTIVEQAVQNAEKATPEVAATTTIAPKTLKERYLKAFSEDQFEFSFRKGR